MTIKNLTGADQLIATSVAATRYRGFSIRNTSTTDTATVRIFDSLTAGGPVLEEVSLSANESAREYYADDTAPTASTGIYVQVVSGSVAGSVRFG